MSLGYQLSEDPAGYLLKRRSPSHAWQCVHGGTACSIICMDRRNGEMYIANAGDSTGVLYCKAGDDSSKACLHPSLVTSVIDAAVLTPSSPKNSTTAQAFDEDESIDMTTSFNYLILTGDHSPENITEYYRLREYRRGDNQLGPALIMAYDAPNTEKVNCPPIYSLNDDLSVVTVTGKGR